jgi:hypothetical protein
MRVHLRTSDNIGHIHQTARPQSRAPLTHVEQAKASDPVWSVRPLLQLQRQYGNRYVQRVPYIARKEKSKTETQGTPKSKQPWTKFINIPDIVISGTDPARHPKYIETGIKALGIAGLGGPFFLVPKVIGNKPAAEVFISRNLPALRKDPFAGKIPGRLNVVYKSKASAEAALRKLGVPDMYSYYIGPGGYIYPTVISDTTAPKIAHTMRLARARERKEAAAARDTSIALLFWYIGARFPVKTKTPAAAPAALKGFTTPELTIIKETKTILNSRKLAQLRAAFKGGKSVTVKITGRTIQYEPKLPASGMTIFGENGFLLGPQAFKSEAELTKTLLHELHRLATSTVKTTGATGAGVAKETAAAAGFAERAFKAAF